MNQKRKNYQRRIKTYRYYVDKNFENLSVDYIFFGRNKSKANTFVPYIPKHEYDDILVYKKIISLYKKLGTCYLIKY